MPAPFDRRVSCLTILVTAICRLSKPVGGPNDPAAADCWALAQVANQTKKSSPPKKRSYRGWGQLNQNKLLARSKPIMPAIVTPHPPFCNDFLHGFSSWISPVHRRLAQLRIPSSNSRLRHYRELKWLVSGCILPTHEKTPPTWMNRRGHQWRRATSPTISFQFDCE